MLLTQREGNGPNAALISRRDGDQRPSLGRKERRNGTQENPGTLERFNEAGMRVGLGAPGGGGGYEVLAAGCGEGIIYCRL